MCGFSGYVSTRNNYNEMVKSLDFIKHRGPDAKGTFHGREDEFYIGLAHCRLSIIDLSDLADQPFQVSSLQDVLVFNGEIYNYRDLKKINECREIHFLTNSDTEVLFHFFRKRGISGLTEVNGMFASAFYSPDEKKLTLFRDHFGIKPLYYFYDKKNREFIFSSEIRGIRSFLTKLTVSTDDVYQFFNNGWIYEPDTGYEEIKKIPPGHAAVLDLNSFELEFHRYYDLTCKKTEHQCFEEVLRNAVNSQTVSDVPLGVFFSGGTDSTVISTQLKKPHTALFVRYCENDLKKSGVTDDYPFAKKIAEKLGMEIVAANFPSTRESEDNDFLKEIEDTAAGVEELISDYTFISSSIISEAAKKNGFKVMLSGMGGDEVFGGYPRYFLCRYEGIFKFLLPVFSLARRFAKKWPRYEKKIDRLISFFEDSSFPVRYSRLLGYFSRSELAGLFENENNLYDRYKEKISRMTDPVKSLDHYHQALYLDSCGFLSHNLIVADKSSMKHALEMRVPLLDYRLYNMMFHAPASEHLSIFQGGKILLKKILRKKLPASLVDRPKTGFNPPLDQKIMTLGRSKVHEVLQENGVFGYLREKTVKKIIDDHYKRRENNTYKIWQLLFFGYWLKGLHGADK